MSDVTERTDETTGRIPGAPPPPRRLLTVGLALAALGFGGAGCGEQAPVPGGGNDASAPTARGSTGEAQTAGPLTAPAPVPDRWRPLIGEYVRGADTLSVLEEGGRLRLLWWGGNREVARLESDTTLSVQGLDEPVLVRRDGDGAVAGLRLDGRSFDRLRYGGEGGRTFRIDPIRPVEELRSEALAASPPGEEGAFRAHELVELVELDSTIELDIRYATMNNFMGARFYSEPRAFLQRPAAEALVRAHRWLKTLGYGVMVFDGYRPWYVTKMFWDATPDSLKAFVADPAGGSRHNRGSAVDLTLYDLETGDPVAMPSGYDEFTPRASASYPGGTMRERWHRRLLRTAMEAVGFTVYRAEWWHFDHREWRNYPLGNQTFEELEGG